METMLLRGLYLERERERESERERVREREKDSYGSCSVCLGKRREEKGKES